MRAVVRSCYRGYTEPLEGGLDYLYADKYNWITTGYGNLVDPVSAAMGLPFVHLDGRVARGDEIAAAWHRVKNDPKAAQQGHRYAKTLTTIRLTPDGLERVFYGKLDSNDHALVHLLPDFEDLPACAQLAMHSWAWACGAGAKFPRLLEAVRERDFARASVEIHIDESGPDHILGTADDNFGLHPRNIANRILMKNAAHVQGFKLDPDFLDWKHEIAVSELPTTPELANPPSSGETVCVDPGPTLHVDPSEYLRNRDDK